MALLRRPQANRHQRRALGTLALARERLAEPGDRGGNIPPLFRVS